MVGDLGHGPLRSGRLANIRGSVAGRVLIDARQWCSADGKTFFCESRVSRVPKKYKLFLSLDAVKVK